MSLTGYDAWKSREPDVVCSCCNGERTIDIQTDVDEVECRPCPECGFDDDERGDADDRPLPTEDQTGLREPE